jgi:hypothetical protein
MSWKHRSSRGLTTFMIRNGVSNKFSEPLRLFSV